MARTFRVLGGFLGALLLLQCVVTVYLLTSKVPEAVDTLPSLPFARSSRK